MPLFSKTSVSPERFIPGKMKPHGCVFCRVPVLDLSYGESGNNIEKQEGAFYKVALTFCLPPRLHTVFEAGFCKTDSLRSGQKLVQPSSISQTGGSRPLLPQTVFDTGLG